MKAVGIGELKTRLTPFVREVCAGEVVLITDRGSVVAEIRAPSTFADPESVVLGSMTVVTLDERIRQNAVALGFATAP